MKADSIFYKLFFTFPASFFELIGISEPETNNYEFTSREVKQLAFRLDGLFLPKDNNSPQLFYLLEL